METLENRIERLKKEQEYFESLIEYNTPIQLGTNLILIVNWNFKWGVCEVYEEDVKLYPTMLIYPKTFNFVNEYRSMRRIIKLIELCKMNKNLYEKLLVKEKLLAEQI